MPSATGRASPRMRTTRPSEVAITTTITTTKDKKNRKEKERSTSCPVMLPSCCGDAGACAEGYLSSENSMSRDSPCLTEEWRNLHHLLQRGIFLTPPTSYMDVIDLMILSVFLPSVLPPGEIPSPRSSSTTTTTMTTSNNCTSARIEHFSRDEKEEKKEGRGKHPSGDDDECVCQEAELSITREKVEVIKGIIIPLQCMNFFSLPLTLALSTSRDPPAGMHEEENDVPPPLHHHQTVGKANESVDDDFSGTEEASLFLSNNKNKKNMVHLTESPLYPSITTTSTSSSSSSSSSGPSKKKRKAETLTVEEKEGTEKDIHDREKGREEREEEDEKMHRIAEGNPQHAHRIPLRLRLLSVLEKLLWDRYAPPFTTDMEFLKMAEVGFLVKNETTHLELLKQTCSFLPLLQRYRLNLYEHLLPILEDLSALIFSHLYARVERVRGGGIGSRGKEGKEEKKGKKDAHLPLPHFSCSYHLPRLIRYAERLQLTRKETKALLYLAVLGSGSLLGVSIDFPHHSSLLCFFSGMNSAEFHFFLRKDREYMEKGDILYERDKSSMKMAQVMLSSEIAAAVGGLRMSTEQRAKLSRSKMREVLLEEEDEEDDEEDEEDEESSKKRREKSWHACGSSDCCGTLRKRNKTVEVMMMREEEEEEEEESDGHAEDGNNDRCEGTQKRKRGGDKEKKKKKENNKDEEEETEEESLDENGGVNEGTWRRKKRKQEDASTVVSTRDKNRPGAATSSSPSSLSTLDHNKEGGCAAADPTTITTTPSPAPSLPQKKMFSRAELDVVEAVSEKNRHIPYEDNCECMEVAFHVMTLKIKIRNATSETKDEDDCGRRSRAEALVRGMEAAMEVAEEVHRSRIDATIAAGSFIPEIELMARRFQLSTLEKDVLILLVGNAISHDILVAINGCEFLRGCQRSMTVGYLIFILCNGLHQRVQARRAFLGSSPLVAHNIITLTPQEYGVREDPASRTGFHLDVMNHMCDIDRKIVDLLVGNTINAREMVTGSSVVIPTVRLERVVLPRATVENVFTRLKHFSMVVECKRECQFGDGLGESVGGLVILFYGPSGTGKTMLAHAVAHELKKKLLLVNLAGFHNAKNASEMLRFLFREAKLCDAIIFFDECESIFASRATNPLLTTLLVEFEKYDGVMLMATNAAHSFDESMNRRISLMVEFKPPDHIMRHQIWQSHLPPQLSLDKDVSLEHLALNYELTGGLIRNAVFAAISNAVAREESTRPTLTMSDLEMGAKQQLRGFFMTTTADQSSGLLCLGGGGGHAGGGGGGGVAKRVYVTPKRHLDDLILDAETKQKINEVAKLTKSRSTLFSLWGFTEENAGDKGSIYLFYGPRGTGKSLAAEGIAYECGVTIRLCNATALVPTEEGGGRREDMQTVFEEAMQLGAMIVIEEAQIFFHQSIEFDAMRLLLYHAMRHTKPVILIASTSSSSSGGGGGASPSFSQAAVDMFRHHFPITLSIPFKMPRRKERECLWKRVFPSGVPFDKTEEIRWDVLSATELSPWEIERVAFRACCRTALLPEPERVLRMKVIEEEVEVERRRQCAGKVMNGMYA